MYKEKDEVTQNKPVFRHRNLKGGEREHDMDFLGSVGQNKKDMVILSVDSMPAL